MKKFVKINFIMRSSWPFLPKFEQNSIFWKKILSSYYRQSNTSHFTLTSKLTEKVSHYWLVIGKEFVNENLDERTSQLHIYFLAD